MKKVVFATCAALALMTSAHAEIKVGGNNQQKVSVQGAVNNMAIGAGSKATQNLASNKGDVNIGGNNTQEVAVQGAVNNMAIGAGTKATQNMASNDSTK